MIYPLMRHTLFPMVRFFSKKTVGFENLPKKGPYILACKHLAALDGIFIGAVLVPYLNKKIHFISNVAKWGWIWDKLIAEKLFGCIPYYKENPKPCLEIAYEQLQQGEIVGIFPEGLMQDYNPKKLRAKTGTARLAIKSKAQIVPIGISHRLSIKSRYKMLPQRRQTIKNSWLNPNSMVIHIGKPFNLSQYYGKDINKEILIEATDIVMDRIDVLTEIVHS